MYTFSFEKLEVCKEASDLVKRLYGLLKDFPQEEKYGLVSQMKRSSISIASNLAEGTSRITYKDKAHFTTMAYSSTMELLNQLILAKELGFLSHDNYIDLRSSISKISNMLNGLRKSQLSA